MRDLPDELLEVIISIGRMPPAYAPEKNYERVAVPIIPIALLVLPKAPGSLYAVPGLAKYK